jgi:hypothetical protein
MHHSLLRLVVVMVGRRWLSVTIRRRWSVVVIIVSVVIATAAATAPHLLLSIVSWSVEVEVSGWRGW